MPQTWHPSTRLLSHHIQDAEGIHGGTIWGSIPAYSKTD